MFMKKTVAVWISAAIHAAGLGSVDAQTSPPELIKVHPRGGLATEDVVLSIEGRHFTPAMQFALWGSLESYVPLNIEFVHSGLVLASVPAGSLVEDVYSLEVFDGESSYSLASCYTVFGDTGSSYPVPVPGPGTGYAMRSVPQFCTVGQLLSVLEDTLGPYSPALYRVLVWRGGRYRDLVELPRGEYLSGASFWVLGRASSVLTVVAPDCWTAVSGAYDGHKRLVVVLEPGWNQISQPFFDRTNDYMVMSWSDVLVDVDGSLPNPVSAAGAGAASWIGSPYSWDGTSYSAVTDLVAGQGYFVYNRTSGPLYLVFDATLVRGPFVTKGSASSARTGGEPLPPPPPRGFTEDGSARSSCGLIGVEAAAFLVLLRVRARRRRPARA
jgi:hypothetical protein